VRVTQAGASWWSAAYARIAPLLRGTLAGQDPDSGCAQPAWPRLGAALPRRRAPLQAARHARRVQLQRNVQVPQRRPVQPERRGGRGALGADQRRAAVRLHRRAVLRHRRGVVAAGHRRVAGHERRGRVRRRRARACRAPGALSERLVAAFSGQLQ